MNSLDIDSLKKILRLQKVRIRAHEKELLERKKAYDEAIEKLDQRNNEIHHIQTEHTGLRSYLNNNHVSESPVKRQYVHVRRFWLNYDLEMHEYYRDQEQNNYDKAKEKYNNSKQAWLREKLKSNKFHDELSSSVNKHQAVIENRHDEISHDDYYRLRIK